jgi:hypothetical protein
MDTLTREPLAKAADTFRIDEVASVQTGLLAYLKDDPVDIAVKIAALRSAADLMAQSISMTLLAHQIRSFIDKSD